MSETGRGLVLLCNAQGVILDIIRNDLHLAHAVPGRMFLRLADGASRIKSMEFLVKIKEAGAILNWEWSVALENGTASLHFSGCQLQEKLLIVGATNGDLAARLYGDVLRMNNEQTNRLRTVVKDREDQVTIEAGLYDQISRLNNELVTMQRELAKTNAELAALNELKNRFLGMASHDLRNPLAIIMTYSEFVLDQASDILSESHLRFLNIVYESSEFMLQLVEDFLDVSVIESGQLRLQPEPVDLVALVAKNVNLNSTLAEKKGISLTFKSDDRVPWMMLDASKIEQVLNNLTSNAVKYSYPGSAVEIRVERQAAHAVITVRDQGQGIPEDELDKLFAAFSKITVYSTAGEKSSGLGLSIAKNIVEGHHGTIWAESEVGKGTTFYVSLPFDPALMDE